MIVFRTMLHLWKKWYSNYSFQEQNILTHDFDYLGRIYKNLPKDQNVEDAQYRFYKCKRCKYLLGIALVPRYQDGVWKKRGRVPLLWIDHHDPISTLSITCNQRLMHKVLK